MDVRFNLPEFKSELNKVKIDLQRRVVRQGLMAAGGAIRDVARVFAPVREATTRKYVRGTRQPIPPGVLRRAIAVFGRKSPVGTSAVIVVPKAGRRAIKGKGSRYLRDAYYWPWVEGGHVIVPRGARGGARVRKLRRERLRTAGRTVRPRPFLAPALRQGSAEALKRFYAQMEKALARYR